MFNVRQQIAERETAARTMISSRNEKLAVRFLGVVLSPKRWVSKMTTHSPVPEPGPLMS